MKSDKYIWDEFKKGEEYALSHIYNQNIDFLFYYGKRITKDENLLLDSIQDLFYELIRTKKNLGDTDNIRLPFTIEKNFTDGPGRNFNLRSDGQLQWGGAQADSKNYKAQFGEFPINYSEGILVGYRWYQQKKIEPQFPFGFGLSYTTYEFKNLKISTNDFTAKGNQTVTVDLDVSNIGNQSGKEVVQVYVGFPSSQLVPQPPLQLKAFDKVDLEPGQTRQVQLKLNPNAFAYWNEQTHGWVVMKGSYKIMAGASSNELPLQTSLTVN